MGRTRHKQRMKTRNLNIENAMRHLKELLEIYVGEIK